jgi:hypothetical protein
MMSLVFFLFFGEKNVDVGIFFGKYENIEQQEQSMSDEQTNIFRILQISKGMKTFFLPVREWNLFRKLSVPLLIRQHPCSTPMGVLKLPCWRRENGSHQSYSGRCNGACELRRLLGPAEINMEVRILIAHLTLLYCLNHEILGRPFESPRCRHSGQSFNGKKNPSDRVEEDTASELGERENWSKINIDSLEYIKGFLTAAHKNVLAHRIKKVQFSWQTTRHQLSTQLGTATENGMIENRFFLFFSSSFFISRLSNSTDCKSLVNTFQKLPRIPPRDSSATGNGNHVNRRSHTPAHIKRRCELRWEIHHL